jgi:hypothetical protein
LLLMCCWYITHPDTLGYHAGTVLWIENYPAVPGLAHLNPRLGYQGLWYVLCAGFSFSFLNLPLTSILPATLTAWLALFLLNKSMACAQEKKTAEAMGLLLLLSYCLWDYNAIRLTASSLSNDLPAAIFAWGAVYLLFQKNTATHHALVFILFSICLKLSMFPLALLGLIVFKSLFSSRKNFIVSLSLALLFLLPLLWRNIITTGYLLYPSPFPDIITADWKLPLKTVQLEKAYILAWARVPGTSHQHAAQVLDLPFTAWIGNWWHLRSIAQQTLLVMVLLQVLYSVFAIKHFLQLDSKVRTILILLFVGIITWWLSAPDPRFALGFLIPFVSVHAWAHFHTFSFGRFRQLFFWWKVGLAAVLLFYCGYRFYNFFERQAFVIPPGIQKDAPSVVNCQELQFTLPQTFFCKDLPVPCLEKPCDSIQRRGKDIQQGFKSNY